MTIFKLTFFLCLAIGLYLHFSFVNIKIFHFSSADKVSCSAAVETVTSGNIEPLIDIKDFSDLRRLILVIRRVMRGIKNWKVKAGLVLLTVL